MRQLYFLFTIAFVIAIQSVSAQYITPGTNLSLSLDQLVSSSGGVVTFDNGTYYINNTLTISATDTLRINSAATIRVAATKRIEVSGTIISNPTSGTVFITAIDTSTVANNFKGFRFDNSQGNIFKNTTITHGGGQQLIASSAIFEYCTFRRNGSSNVSAVITYSGCSPIIKYCSFIENARSAVGSGANVSGSPHILYNYLYRNTTDNSNRPQINIGPGSNDTLYIVGNYIEGFYDNAGGIGLSNLLSTGSTKAVVKDNTIIGNRYGYAQIGNSISALITDNIILDNDIQNNPNLGGSGLNFQASGSGNTAIVRRNIISGSLWGITIQSVAQPDFGTTDNPGNNVIYENGNGGATYALYNNTVLPINAVGNYWGTNDPIEAENYIFHQPDQASLGLVTYLPIYTLEPVIQSFGFLAADNAGLSADVFGTINQTNKTINVVLPAGTSVNALIPEIGLALGVTTIPAGGVITDFTQPVTFEVKTPHGLNENYVVTVSVEVATFSATFQISNTSSQTITDAIIQLNGTTYPAGTYFFDNLSPGTYDYTVSHPNYQPANGNFIITDQNVVVPVTIVPLSYTVTFDIKNTAGTAITNAIVTLNGQTNPEGNYVFSNILPNTYIYSVIAAGYNPISGNTAVVNQNITVNIVMQWTVYNITFTVHDNNALPLETVLITLENHGSQLTDATGTTVFTSILPGSYNYEASKDMYFPITGTATITNENSVIPLVALLTGIGETAALSGVGVYPNPASDFIVIDARVDEEFDIHIIDVNGKVVLKKNAVSSTDKIQLQGLNTGVYIVVIENETDKKAVRLNVQ